jgi:Ca-activated chloride channel family protein
MFFPAFLERIGRFVQRGGAEDAEDRTASGSERVVSPGGGLFPQRTPARYRSRFCSNERVCGEEKPRHAQVGIKATVITLALLFSTAPLCTAHARTNVTSTQTTRQPAPQQTPTPTPTPADGEAVERIESDATNVLLTAKDSKGRFVTSLRPADVRVLEDGVEQQVSLFERETDAPVSLALLVDASASQEKVMGEEQTAASAFVRTVLRPGKDSASVVSFTGVTRLDQPLTEDPDQLLSAIARLKVEYTADTPACRDENAPEEVVLRCRTGVWDAVVLSIREVLSKTPERTRRAVILLSDGDDTSSKLRIYQAVEYAVRNDTVVYSIGIRDRHFREGEMRRDFLRDISEQTGGRAFFPKDAEDLAAAFAQIQDELRSQYLISYTPTNRSTGGTLRKVQVEIANPALRKEKLHLFYRQGYYARMKDEGGRMK